ncbi:MAG: 3-methyl-2-oxobutanoate hydroxymethyltransferase [Chloroflexi bacterium]|nr:MAG: 3-methyl-2-oxobutanoate hydroxymethyltransferase [Chloroflexota bacterium]TMG41104.1 MAG: 3-methyl-2-oxobutanoate hydroxymethyltransferase [Chloroflexota bacterium]
MSEQTAYGGATTVPPKKITVPDVVAMKRDRKRITMMTAYDAAFAKLVDQAGIDVILVGDSLGMVVLGYPTTVPVTMDDMVRHAAAVSRGATRPLLVGDMPFGTYQAGPQDALRNAARFLKEAGMDAVKLEGGHEVVETVRALVDSGIAVMGHVGLTPQRVAQFGGFKVQAKTARAARRLIEDCLALEDAGAFSIVLESVPAPVAALASERLGIPTIGIGAGVDCDGQVLVLHDVLGLFGEFKPKFAKRYADIGTAVVEALREYDRDVRAGTFPDDEHSFTMKESELVSLQRSLTQKAG